MRVVTICASLFLLCVWIVGCRQATKKGTSESGQPARASGRSSKSGRGDGGARDRVRASAEADGPSQNAPVIAEGERAEKSGNYQRARALYEQACKGGEAPGCFNAGIMLHEGQGGPQDAARALRLFVKACDVGLAQGCYNSGFQYLHGEGVQDDRLQAAALFAKACDGNFARGCIAAGRVYSGDGPNQNYPRAEQFFRKACSQGDDLGCKSQANIAELIKIDEKIKRKDEQRAQLKEGWESLLDKTCTSTYKLFTQIFILGSGYEDAKHAESIDTVRGCGQPLVADALSAYFQQSNKRMAARLFSRSCNAGQEIGCHFAATMAVFGENPGMGPGQGLTSLRQMCSNGNKASCQVVKYADEQNRKASAPRRRAASPPTRDLPRATLAYRKGFRAEFARQPARARALYDESCQWGYTTGCRRLGYMLYKGEGGPKDMARAREAYHRACGLGSKTACKEEKFVERQETSE